MVRMENFANIRVAATLDHNNLKIYMNSYLFKISTSISINSPEK